MGKNKNKNKKKKKRKNRIFSDLLIVKAKSGENKSIKMEIQHVNQAAKAENVKKLDPNEFKNEKTEQKPSKVNKNESNES